MSEKVSPPSPQSGNMQGSNFLPEDEVSLLDILEILDRKKALVFIATFILTLLSMVYVFSITPIYRATIGFQQSESNLALLFPGFVGETFSEDYRKAVGSLVGEDNHLLNKFFAKLLSYPIQEKVFNDGSFLQRFAADNPDAGMKKTIMHDINRSIHPGSNGKSGKVSGQTVIFEMEGTKPVVISDFLNALAEQAKNEVVQGEKELMRQGIELLKDKYSAEKKKINLLIKSENTDKVRFFKDNLEIAKNLGVLDNNFSGPQTNVSLLFGARSDKKSAFLLGERPIWYLYGQRALEQELKLLERGRVPHQYMQEIAELDYKIAYLSNIDLSKISIEPVIISQQSIPPIKPIEPKRVKIVFIGIILGLFIGIFLVFLSHLMDQLKKRPKLS